MIRMASTPPMQAHTVNTPHSPLHGAKYDSYEPYSTRRSTRQASRRAAVTPEPAPRSPESAPLPSNLSKSKKSHTTRRILHTYSPPSSNQTSPNSDSASKSKAKSLTSKKVNFPRSPGSLGSPRMDIFSDDMDSTLLQPGPARTVHGLPTPAKTPRKQPLQQKAAVASAARVLFPSRSDTVEEVMPKTGRSRRSRDVVLSMGDVDGSAEDESIKVFTDSRDRFPSLDRDTDNPFIDPPDQGTGSSSRRVKRRKTNGVQSSEEIKEAFDHEEGMVYVFRGKKVFKKFPSEWRNTIEDNQSSPEQTSHHHFTRSSIKPRLLFPTEAQRRERQIADEEAPTDIEDPNTTATEMTDAEAQEEEKVHQVSTPVKEKFGGVIAPATPPSTIRKPRGRTAKHDLHGEAEVIDEGGPKPKRRSPFDGWARRKVTTIAAGSSSAGVDGGVAGKKRMGETLERNGAGKISRVEGESFSSL